MPLPNDPILLVQDPGKTTGLVTYVPSTKSFNTHELDFENTARTILTAAATHRERLVIISESFRITVQTAKNTQAPWSLELIGAARMCSMLYCGRDIVLQDPAAAKRFASDARLRAMGWYSRGRGHANDAARHLLLFTATRRLIESDTLRAIADI